MLWGENNTLNLEVNQAGGCQSSFFFLKCLCLVILIWRVDPRSTLKFDCHRKMGTKIPTNKESMWQQNFLTQMAVLVGVTSGPPVSYHVAQT